MTVVRVWRFSGSGNTLFYTLPEQRILIAINFLHHKQVGSIAHLVTMPSFVGSH